MRAEIAASVDAVQALCLRLRAELAGLPRRVDRFAVELLCREALANAAEHGSGFEPSKRIWLELRSAEGLLVCRVSDEGRGFPAPPTADSLPAEPRERGMGLEIMRRYSDRVYFEDGGRTLVFERRIEEGGGNER